MGRIKSKMVKRTSIQVISLSEDDFFKKDFESNKKLLGTTMPSKRIRNKIAGYISRIKKNTKSILQENVN